MARLLLLAVCTELAGALAATGFSHTDAGLAAPPLGPPFCGDKREPRFYAVVFPNSPLCACGCASCDCRRYVACWECSPAPCRRGRLYECADAPWSAFNETSQGCEYAEPLFGAAALACPPTLPSPPPPCAPDAPPASRPPPARPPPKPPRRKSPPLARAPPAALPAAPQAASPNVIVAPAIIGPVPFVQPGALINPFLGAAALGAGAGLLFSSPPLRLPPPPSPPPPSPPPPPPVFVLPPLAPLFFLPPRAMRDLPPPPPPPLLVALPLPPPVAVVLPQPTGGAGRN